MKMLGNIAFAAAVGASALVLTAASASARIVCNREGECWHVHGAWEFHPGFGLVVHPDDWRWREGEHFTWREHEGRGYWRGGHWIGF